MVLPLIWIAGSAIAGIATGLVYEKESNKKIVQDISAAASSSEPKISWLDKAIMAGAGVAALYVWRSTR